MHLAAPVSNAPRIGRFRLRRKIGAGLQGTVYLAEDPELERPVAVKLLQIALERNTTHFLLWLELGNCQLALGMTGPAERSFNEARQLNPDCSEARLALTRVAATGFWLRVRGAWRQIFER